MIYRTISTLTLCALSLVSTLEGQTSVGYSHAQTRQALEVKKKALSEGNLFSIFHTAKMTSEEREAMEFVYAYMPTNDIVDFSGDVHLANVRSALKARREMPWGQAIPQREWRHFVLPARVNNEKLDSARLVFYEALKDRVRGLSLHDAVLEVNHWCHERVTYAPSDSRTSSPLATIRSAYGRCGEESTLLVAALRSVGIPARQVYTPRWAHTDDNHAWVEAWVDGRWAFLGACEPAPVLNLGWFNAPASRAMLVHTRVFGRYDGPEEVITTTPYYTEINVIDNYTESATVEVQVVDSAGRVVPRAHVDFRVYNYGEFYPVVRKVANEQGVASLRAGRGDLLVLASGQVAGAGYRFGLHKASFGQDKQITIRLDHKLGDRIDTAIDLVPPREQARIPEVSEALRMRCDLRLAQGDSMRNAYVATFLEEQIEGLDARGNWQTLRTFVETAPDHNKALALLSVISAKDRRDITLEILSDHLTNTMPQPVLSGESEDFLMKYIYSPRVANEHLTPYKRFFAQVISPELRRQLAESPEAVALWCRANIKPDSDYNPMMYAMSPEGVWRSRRADARSMGLFFVALARSIGWAARIDAITGKVQYYRDASWVDAVLTTDTPQQTHVAPQGTLQLAYTNNGITDNPRYYTHFSLSQMTEQGPRLLTYDESDNGLEQGVSWDTSFRGGMPVDAGHYMLVSGLRMANGSVLAQLKTFSVGAGQQIHEDLIMRRDTTQVAVIGSFNAESLLAYIGDTAALTKQASSATEADRSLLSVTGRGYYILGIIAAQQEPTNHALRDLSALRATFERWGRPLVLVFADDAQRQRFSAAEFPDLPSTTVYGVDIDGQLLKQIKQEMKLRTDNLPVFIIADTFNRVVFVSQGYTIGLGEQLNRVLVGISDTSAPPQAGSCTLP